ncbi:MAG: hypothetical protein HYZ65_07885 [Burkholderiales bacterium]|nr:hypothetical protein [Burkholderiales bacterium]
MALYFIEAVRLDSKNQRVQSVLWGKSRGGEVNVPAYVAEPAAVPVGAVIDAISAGDEVVSKFTINGCASMGASLCMKQYEDGSIGVETVESEDGRKLQDLPRF